MNWFTDALDGVNAAARYSLDATVGRPKFLKDAPKPSEAIANPVRVATTTVAAADALNDTVAEALDATTGCPKFLQDAPKPSEAIANPVRVATTTVAAADALNDTLAEALDATTGRFQFMKDLPRPSELPRELAIGSSQLISTLKDTGESLWNSASKLFFGKKEMDYTHVLLAAGAVGAGLYVLSDNGDTEYLAPPSTPQGARDFSLYRY